MDSQTTPSILFLSNYSFPEKDGEKRRRLGITGQEEGLATLLEERGQATLPHLFFRQ